MNSDSSWVFPTMVAVVVFKTYEPKLTIIYIFVSNIAQFCSLGKALILAFQHATACKAMNDPKQKKAQDIGESFSLNPVQQ